VFDPSSLEFSASPAFEPPSPAVGAETVLGAVLAPSFVEPFDGASPSVPLPGWVAAPAVGGEPPAQPVRRSAPTSMGAAERGKDVFMAFLARFILEGVRRAHQMKAVTFRP
jgi:hypothetical protein